MAQMSFHHLACALQATDPLSQRIAAVQAAQDLKKKYPTLAVINHTEVTQSNWAKRGDDQTLMNYLWLKRNQQFYPFFPGGYNFDKNKAIVSPKVTAGNANVMLYDPKILTWKRGTGQLFAGLPGVGGISPTRVVGTCVLTVNATPAAARFWMGHAIDGFETGRGPKSYRRASYNRYLELCRKVVTGGTIPSIGSLDANHTKFPQLLNVKGAQFANVGGTLGGRHVDWTVAYRMGVWLGNPKWRITMTGQTTLQLPYNDHRSVLTKYTIDY